MMFHRGHPCFQGALLHLDAFKDAFLRADEKSLPDLYKHLLKAILPVIVWEIDIGAVNRIPSNAGVNLSPLLTKPREEALTNYVGAGHLLKAVELGHEVRKRV